MRSVQARRTSAFAATTTTWAPLVADGSFDVVLPAAGGDWVEAGVSIISPSGGGNSYLDVAVIVGGSVVSWVSTSSLTHTSVSGWFRSNGHGNIAISGATLYKVKAGDIEGGSIRLRLYSFMDSGSAAYIASTSDPAVFYGVSRVSSAVLPPVQPSGFVGWGVPALIEPPLSIPTGSILWMRGRDLTGAAGSTISAWPDASPAARTISYVSASTPVTVAAASTPKGGKSAAFPGNPGSGSYFTVGATALPTNRDGEVWLVVKSNDVGGSSNGWCKFGGDAGQENHYGYGGSVYDDDGCSSRLSHSAAGLTAWHIRRVQTTGTTRYVWINGGLVWSGAVTPHWRQAPNIGAANSYRFNGNIAEVIMFDRALSAADATKTNDYLLAEHM